MITANDLGEISIFIFGGIALSLMFWNPNPMIAGFIVALIMFITKAFFKGTPIDIQKHTQMGKKE